MSPRPPYHQKPSWRACYARLGGSGFDAFWRRVLCPLAKPNSTTIYVATRRTQGGLHSSPAVGDLGSLRNVLPHMTVPSAAYGNGPLTTSVYDKGSWPGYGVVAREYIRCMQHRSV